MEERKEGRKDKWQRKEIEKVREYEEETSGKNNGEKWGGKTGSNIETRTAKNRLRKKGRESGM